MKDDGFSRGMFWLGAFAGLIVALSLAAMLSLAFPLGPVEGDGKSSVPLAKSDQEPGEGSETAALLVTELPVLSAPSAGDDMPSGERSGPKDAAASRGPIGEDETAAAPLAAPENDSVSALPAIGDAPSEKPGSADGDSEADRDLAGLEAAEPAAEPASELGAPSEMENTDPSGGALKANAAPWQGKADGPVMAIVLTGIEGEENREVYDPLLLLPAPLTTVLAPGAGESKRVSAALRSAGFEVLIGVDSATLGTAPVDAVSAVLEDVGPVIGIAALGKGMINADRAELMVVEAEARGMALLDMTAEGGTQPYRMARAAGLPAAPTGRSFDEASANLVYLTLDRAASDAAVSGALVVTAEATPAVLSGLRRWLKVRGGTKAALAPLSVVIERLADGAAE